MSDFFRQEFSRRSLDLMLLIIMKNILETLIIRILVLILTVEMQHAPQVT